MDGIQPEHTPSGAAGINGSANQGNLGGADTGVVQQPGADGAEGTVVGGNVVLGVGKSDSLGAYLIGYNGMTVYTFAKDKTGTSTCYGQCASIWPPYVIGPEDNAQNVKLGVDGNKVSTITRTDGTLQVTYDGRPLYFYAQDSSPNDTKGQNFNKVWFVVKP
jgi:predicted lipoprotein with Yx(FWY)xxD motif